MLVLIWKPWRIISFLSDINVKLFGTYNWHAAAWNLGWRFRTYGSFKNIEKSFQDLHFWRKHLNGKQYFFILSFRLERIQTLTLLQLFHQSPLKLLIENPSENGRFCKTLKNSLNNQQYTLLFTMMITIAVSSRLSQ